jgi:hypothetical protein
VKLPEIAFGASQVQSVAPAQAAVGEALGRFSNTVSDGLRMIHQEMVKTQTQQAALDLAERGSAFKQLIATKKFWSPQELTDALGKDGYAKLPEQLRQQGEVLVPKVGPDSKPVVNPDGSPVMEAQGIPTHIAYEPLFKTIMGRNLEEASKRVAAPGWRAEFQRHAEGDLLQLWNGIHEEQTKALIAEDVATRDAQWKGFANLGRFDLAAAAINGMREYVGAEGVAARNAALGGMEQERPVFDAIQAGRTARDPKARAEAKADLSDALVRLADPARMGLIDPVKRDRLAREVGTLLAQLDSEGAKGIAGELVFRMQRDKVAADPKNPDRFDLRAAMLWVQKQFEDGGDHAGDRAQFTDVTREAEQLVRRWNEGLDGQTQAVADEVARLFYSTTPPSLSNVDPKLLARLAMTEDGAKKHAWFSERDRQYRVDWVREDARWKTPEQVDRAAQIEWSLAFHAAEWRALGHDGVLDVVRGKAPIPGRPNAPPGGVNLFDEPELFRKALGVAQGPETFLIQSPEETVLSTLATRFKSLHTKKWTESDTAAYHEVLDRVTREINRYEANEGNGKKPDTGYIRQFVREQMEDEQVQKAFLGVIPYTGKTTRVEAQLKGKAYTTKSGAKVQPPDPRKRAEGLRPGYILVYKPDPATGTYTPKQVPADKRDELPEGWVREGEEFPPLEAAAPASVAAPRLVSAAEAEDAVAAVAKGGSAPAPAAVPDPADAEVVRYTDGAGHVLFFPRDAPLPDGLAKAGWRNADEPAPEPPPAEEPPPVAAPVPEPEPEKPHGLPMPATAEEKAAQVEQARQDRVREHTDQALKAVGRERADAAYQRGGSRELRLVEAELEKQRADIEAEVARALPAWDEYRKTHPGFGKSFGEWCVKHRNEGK